MQAKHKLMLGVEDSQKAEVQLKVIKAWWHALVGTPKYAERVSTVIDKGSCSTAADNWPRHFKNHFLGNSRSGHEPRGFKMPSMVPDTAEYSRSRNHTGSTGNGQQRPISLKSSSH